MSSSSRTLLMQPSITLRFKLSSVFETISGKIHCLRLFLRRGVLRCAFRLDAGGMKDAIASEPPLRHGLHAVFERVGRGFHPLVDYRQGFVLLNQHELNALARALDGTGGNIAGDAQALSLN